MSVTTDFCLNQMHSFFLRNFALNLVLGVGCSHCKKHFLQSSLTLWSFRIQSGPPAYNPFYQKNR